MAIVQTRGTTPRVAPIFCKLPTCRSFPPSGHAVAQAPLHNLLRNSPPSIIQRGQRKNALGRRKNAFRPCSSSFSQPCPFVEADFFKASLQVIGKEDSTGGMMLYQKMDSEGKTEDPEKVLAVAIGGDTFQAICLLVAGRQDVRPLSVNLLWRVLQRGMDISKKEWTILRVAVTGQTETAFLGRIWFGNAVTGEASWDVDCRPSDATWLAVKCGAPIYIHKAVWANASVDLDHLRHLLQSSRSNADTSSGNAGQGASVSSMVDVKALMATVMHTDPEPVKLLKMELKVALGEENYEAAARIRDHPFMRMHLAAFTARKEGDVQAASRYEHQLWQEIAMMEAMGKSNRDSKLVGSSEVGSSEEEEGWQHGGGGAGMDPGI